jgi:nucleotide-binding universal stress UspA family protein
VPFRRILCPTDFSDHASAAADCCLRVAEAFGAHVLFLHVFDVTNLPIITAYPYYYGQANQEMVDDMQTRAEEALAIFVAQKTVSAKGFQFDRRMVTGRTATQILEQAELERIELIVMGTSGMGRVRELLGSVVHKVVREAHCPVLTVPAADGA